MYGLELLVQVILFLRPLHLAFHAGIDIAIDVEFLDLAFQNFGYAVQTIQNVEIFEEFLFFLHRNLQIGRDRIGELGRILHPSGGNHGVVIQALRKLHILFKKSIDAPHRLIDLRRRFDTQRKKFQGCAVETLFTGELHDLGALDAFHQHANIAVGKLDALHNVCERSDCKDLLRLGIIDRSIVLCGQENLLFSCQRLFQRAHRRFPPDDERLHHLRENNHVPHGHHRHTFHFTLLAGKH